MLKLVTTEMVNNVYSEMIPAEEATAQSSTNVPGQLFWKSRLQELAQRSGLPLPVYQTINEGAQHAPRFRSTVYVDGTYITSPNTFPLRRAAEHDVASVALATLFQKIKEEGYPIIREDTVFCKSIINEYAVKMNLEMPTYTTIQPKGLLPSFISSLVFNGVNYTGEAGRNKKEAEQLAARAVILSIFGNNESGTVIPEIIKSKFKLYAALHKVKDVHQSNNSNTPMSENMGAGFVLPFANEKEVETTGNGNALVAIDTGNSFDFPLSDKKDVADTGNSFDFPLSDKKDVAVTGGANNMTISTTSKTCVSQIIMEQPLGVGPSSARNRNRKNKRKMKKLKVNAELSVDAMQVEPLDQIALCSVSQ